MIGAGFHTVTRNPGLVLVALSSALSFLIGYAQADQVVPSEHSGRFRFFDMPSNVTTESPQATCDYPYGPNIWYFLSNGADLNLCTATTFPCTVGACYYKGEWKTDVLELMTCPPGAVENGVDHKCYLQIDPRKDYCGEEEGNPINRGSGVKRQRETDYSSAMLKFNRTYASYRWWNYASALSSGWTSNLHSRRVLFFPGAGGEVARAEVDRGDSKRLLFYRLPSAWLPDADITDTLTELKDASNVRTGWRYTTSDDDVELYDATGKLLSITNRAGLTQTLIYSDAATPTSVAPAPGLLIRVTDASARSLNFTYDASNRITTMTDPAGGVYVYGYDANNNLSYVSYPDATPLDDTDNPKKTYLYNEPTYTSGANLPHALTGIIDENGVRFATYAYDASGRAISSEHAGGVDKVTLNYTVDPNANNGNGTTIVTDAFNTTRTYNFQTILGVVKNTSLTQPCTSCGGNAANTSYDPNGNIASRTDFNGYKTTYLYDLTRNLETSRTEGLLSSGAATPATRTIQTEWHPNFRLPTKVTEAGRVTLYSYDAISGNLLAKTITDTVTNASRTTTYTYTTTSDGTLANLLKSIDGPRTDITDITAYTYYPNGDLKTTTNALGHTTQVTQYDANGRALTMVDPNGVTTSFSYSPRGWLLTKTVGGELTTYTYDNVGNLKQVNSPAGEVITYTYDAAHRLTDITDQLNHRIHYTLDAMGNRTREEVFNSANTLVTTQSRSFDALNRLYQDIGALNQTTTYSYDANGNLKEVTNPLLNKTQYQYDALNRLNQVTDANGGLTQYDYSALDQVKTVADPRALATQYTVNAFGEQTKLVSPDTGVTNHTYDAAGNLKTTTDARNKTTTYTYDALNRVSQISFADGTTHSFSYDAAPNAIGRLISITDEAGITRYSYNALGRLTQKSQTIGSLTQTLAYEYDSQGRLTKLTYPSGRAVNYSYTLGKLTGLSVTPANGSPTVLIGNIQYQPFSRPKSWVWGNGFTYTTTFDSDGRLTDYPLGAITKHLDYDAASRITQLNDVANPINNLTLAYDKLDRLSSLTTSIPANNQSFNYDATGNRTLHQVGSTSFPYTTEATSNRLMQVGSIRMNQYDPAGNLTQDGTYVYTYNARNRLNSATKGTTSHQYTYNALGQRIKKNGPQVTTGANLFMYGEEGQLLGEYDAQGLPLTETVYLGTSPVGVVK